MRIHILITIFLIVGKTTFGQHTVQLPGAMENAQKYLCNVLDGTYISSARSISSTEIPVFFFKQIEKHFLLLGDTAKYSFLGIPIDQILISLNEDSLITAFGFIIADNAKNIGIVLKHFGEESPGWTSTSSISDGEPEPLYHMWNAKEYCVRLTSPTFPGKFPEYNNKLILRISKCLYPDYVCPKREQGTKMQ